MSIQQYVLQVSLIRKAPITTAADDIHKYIFNCFSEKIRLDVSSESSATSAKQRIHMKKSSLIFFKDKSEKINCLLLQFLFGAISINTNC